ncbi:MAG TPA: SRPBCC family protein [Acidimicrobiia bacterium]|nr:SRPBCC family protein [Acidimicrobiia bacterium]
MSRRSRVIKAPPKRVFDALLTAENFGYWVVGSKKVRDVDDDWPKPGSVFHHSIGVGPLHIDDHTEIVGIDAPRRLDLSARMGPLGSAAIRLLLQPKGRRRTKVIMEETPESGPIRWAAPRLLVNRAIGVRNAGSLRRLARLVEKPESVPHSQKGD